MMNKNNLFFSTPKPFDMSKGMIESEEGNHFWLSPQDAREGKKQLGHRYIYSIYSYDLKKPVIIDEDVILWNGDNLKELMLCKLNEEPYDIWGDNKDFILPDQVHINLNERDRNSINKIKTINDVFDFIRSKGYDHIKYKNTQELDSDSVVLNHDSNFDYNTLTEIR